VRQTVANNSLHQEIVYANQTTLSGENVLTVDIGPPEDSTFLRPPSVWQIKNEMRSVLPVAMSLSPVIGSNTSGVYGYATATIGNGSCLYAWQQVKTVAPADSTGFAKLTRRHLAATIRLRYCHPSITTDRIHVLMDGLRLKDVNSQTLDVLRFAASSADVAQPLAVVTPERVVVRKRRIIRQAAVVPDDEDWKNPQRKAVTESANPDVIDNASTVPLPESATDRQLTVPADDSTASRQVQIDNAATVPLPE
jgi:hypothetical protein